MKTTQYTKLALGLMLTQPVTLLMAQQPPPWEANQSAPAPVQQFNQQQLAALVAPIALYPDALLSQILVAATYPAELQQAGQWLQSSGNLSGPDLVAAAGQQPWDASVQALVVFPDVVSRMTSNMQWTTDLGNAFIAQRGDVMNAVQMLRAQARASGRLASTPQQNVIDQDQGPQNMIEIEPTDPETVYVPNYNPAYIWGAPAYGYAYPSLYYPGAGFGFGYGISIGRFFGGGLGWRSWGWRPNWYGHTIIQNNSFFSRYRFNGYSNRGHYYGSGSAAWSHNPSHRMGVPYRSGGSYGNNGGRSFSGGTRYQQPAPRSNSRGYTSPEHRSAPSAYSGGNRGSYGGGHQAAPSRGFSNGNFGDRGRSAPSYQARPSPSQGHQASPRNFGGGGAQSRPSHAAESHHQNSYHASPRSNSGGSRPTPSSRQQSHPSGGGGGGHHGRGK